MKTILKNKLSSEDEKKLVAELNILKTLDHPNIIKVLEVYEDKNTYKIITELNKNSYYNIFRYCEGGDLFSAI